MRKAHLAVGRRAAARAAAWVARFRADRRGATAVEYGLILALIVIAMIVALANLADSTIGMWRHVDNKVANAR